MLCLVLGCLLLSLSGSVSRAQDSKSKPAASHDRHASGQTSGQTHAAHAASVLPRSERPKDARVYFITPQGGETLSSPVVVRFGLEGMGVAPAGVDKSATGHHHLIVDAALPPVGLPIPQSDSYRHFGNGQTEVHLDLAPGVHTLQLLLGDHLHIPHDPPVVSERISITVKE